MISVLLSKLLTKLWNVFLLISLLLTNSAFIHSVQADGGDFTPVSRYSVRARGNPRSAPSRSAVLAYSAAIRSEIVAVPLKCIAFSPYINGYDPNQPNNPGKMPPAALIDTLLDVVVQHGYNCILTYGVTPPLDHIFPAAQARGLKVIANIWLEPGIILPPENSTSIQKGIDAALAYPDTIIRLSCGVEVRNRAINTGLPLSAAENAITDCINKLHHSGVTQPITTIDTWWNWCNATQPCQTWSIVNSVDWIGINVYPWWENKYSGIHTCIPAADAPQFHINRINEVKSVYATKEVILTEFGWPAGPEGYSESNIFSDQKCGIASKENQEFVISETIKKLDNAGVLGVVFEAFREPWKVLEGTVGPYWGTIAPVFDDVPFEYWAWKFVEGLYNAGVTSGCSISPMMYCPTTTVTRDQMAVFLLKGKHGSSYTPPPATGVFSDVPTVYWAADWIEQLATEGITSGCGSGKYCPTTPVTREQMAVFLLKAKYGSGYVPPDPVGMFLDVPVSSPYARWIEKLASDGITSGCGSGNYCPATTVTRDQMAVFLVKNFNLL